MHLLLEKGLLFLGFEISKTLFLETGGVIQDSVLLKIGHQLTTVVGNATLLVFRPCTASTRLRVHNNEWMNLA